jgi:hypothetical protein
MEAHKMKTLTLALSLAALTGAAFAQTSTCVALHFQQTLLCTFPDGSGTEQTNINETLKTTDYTPETWHAHYVKLLDLDAKYLKGSAAIHAKYVEAGAIHAKKPCLAAGFTWAHNVCDVPLSQIAPDVVTK